MSNTISTLIQLTEMAISKVKSLATEEKKPNAKLRIYIQGGGCGGFQYGFILDDKINEGDIIIEKQGAMLVVDSVSIKYLIGGVVDYVEELTGSRFVINNPNAKNICGCGYSFSI